MGSSEHKGEFVSQVHDVCCHCWKEKNHFDQLNVTNRIGRRFTTQHFHSSRLYAKLVAGAATCLGKLQRSRKRFDAENSKVANHN